MIDKDNFFMEEIECVVIEKYEVIKEKLFNVDNEMIVIFMVINVLLV